MIEEFEYVGTRVFIDLTKVESAIDFHGLVTIRMASGHLMEISDISIEAFVKRWQIATAAKP